uniref:hypothetical protein n=1 Tax=Parapedobacter tibetensis TaxID=2972951 RepID=UPI00214DDCEC|nr:hypothetical protein [Parapedobacter tibetensis]
MVNTTGKADTTKKFILGKASKRPPVMSDSEVMCVLLLFHLSGFRCFKHFYLFYVQRHMQVAPIPDFDVSVAIDSVRFAFFDLVEN